VRLTREPVHSTVRRLLSPLESIVRFIVLFIDRGGAEWRGAAVQADKAGQG